MSQRSECGQPTSAGGWCRKAPTDDYNPLGFCADHLDRYRAAMPEPWPAREPDGATLVLDFGGRR